LRSGITAYPVADHEGNHKAEEASDKRHEIARVSDTARQEAVHIGEPGGSGHEEIQSDSREQHEAAP